MRHLTLQPTAAMCVCVLAGLCLGQWAQASTAPVSSARPNLVFLIADEHRRQAMGFMHDDPIKTPNLDRLAQQGVVMANAISSYPVCSPWRGMTFTGRYPMSNGVVRNGESWLPGTVTIFDVLKQNGYATAYVGKWHLSDLYKRKPNGNWDIKMFQWKIDPQTQLPYRMIERTPSSQRPAFDYWLGNSCFNDMFQLLYFENDSEKPTLGRGWQPDFETAKAQEFMTKCQQEGRPFACFISWNPPHHNWEADLATKADIKNPCLVAPKEFRQPYESLIKLDRPNFDPKAKGCGPKAKVADDLPGYFGGIAAIDAQVGQVMKFLEEKGLAENTILIYTSDHGDAMGSHGFTGKQFWTEESIGVPFLVRWPKKLKPSRQEMVFGNVNIMPTLLGLMNLPVPSSVQGRDFSSVLRGEVAASDQAELITHVCSFTRKKVSDTQFQLTEARYYVLNEGEWRGLRGQRYVYVIQIFRQGIHRYLYDLQTDPYQMKPAYLLNRRPAQGTDAQETLMAQWEARLRSRLAEAEAADPFFNWVDDLATTPPWTWNGFGSSKANPWIKAQAR